MTVLSRNSLRTGSAVVGFAPIRIGDESKVYAGVRFSCPITNTCPILIGPAPNDIQYEIWPGHDLDLQIESSAMWAFAQDDVDQRLFWVSL